MLRRQDCPAAKAILLEAFPVLDARAVRYLLCHEREHMQVERYNGQVVGFIRLSLPRHSDIAWVDYLAVMPAARGSPAATQLMAWACEQASAQGRRRMELSVHQDSGRALAFYRRLGFQSLARRGQPDFETLALDLVPASTPARATDPAMKTGWRTLPQRAANLLRMPGQLLTLVAYELTLWSDGLLHWPL